MTIFLSSDDRWDLLTRLLRLAVGSVDKRNPAAVLTTMPVPLPRIQAWANAALVLRPEEFGAALHNSLSTGPVFAVPPWDRGGPDQRSGESLGASGSYMYERILAECRPSDAQSTIVVLLPASAMTLPSGGRWREALGQHWHIPFVIYSTGVLAEVHAAFELAGAVLRARAGRPPKPTRIYRIPQDVVPDDVVADFENLLTMKGGRRAANGFVSRTPIEPKVGYAFDRHDPELARRQQAWADFGRMVPLAKLCEVSMGTFHPVQERENVFETQVPGSLQVLAGRDVLRDGTLAPPDEHTRWARLPGGRQLQEGDILVRYIFRIDDGEGLVLARVSQNHLPATAAGNSVIVLRPRKATTETQVELLQLFLRTPLAKRLAIAGSSTMRDHALLGVRALGELLVPQPDEALAAAMNDMKVAAQQLNNWQSEAMSLVKTVFLDEPRKARARLIESGRKLRMRADAAAQIDDFSHAVRSRYPYPVALRWRHVEASIGAEAPEGAYKKVLRTAEVLTCYVALLGVVAAREAGITLGTMSQFPERLQTGVSFGDWIHVLHEVGNKLKQLPDDAPLAVVRSLPTDKAVADALGRLHTRRNDYSHDRECDPASLLHESHADLCTVVAGAEFLCDLKMLLITDVSYDSLRQVSTVRYQEMMGDHSVVSSQTMTYDGPNVEKDSLYLRDDLGGLHLLRPFLIGRRCEVCSQWGIFHVDKAPKGSEGVVIKSLDHGHAQTVTGMREPLRHVGLL